MSPDQVYNQVTLQYVTMQEHTMSPGQAHNQVTPHYVTMQEPTIVIRPSI